MLPSYPRITGDQRLITDDEVGRVDAHLARRLECLKLAVQVIGNDLSPEIYMHAAALFETWIMRDDNPPDGDDESLPPQQY